jgi:hypothetical protein
MLLADNAPESCGCRGIAVRGDISPPVGSRSITGRSSRLRSHPEWRGKSRRTSRRLRLAAWTSRGEAIPTGTSYQRPRRRPLLARS